MIEQVPIFRQQHFFRQAKPIPVRLQLSLDSFDELHSFYCVSGIIAVGRHFSKQHLLLDHSPLPGYLGVIPLLSQSVKSKPTFLKIRTMTIQTPFTQKLRQCFA